MYVHIYVYIYIYIYIYTYKFISYTYTDMRIYMYGHTLTHVSMRQSHIETDATVKRHCVRIQQDIQCI